jgi:hypothetical protein
MRGDDLSGTVQYLKQMIWMIFLKIYDAQEEKSSTGFISAIGLMISF